MKENDRLPLVRSGSQVVNAEPAGRSELRGDAVEMADRIAWLCDEEIHNSLLALSRERDSRGSQRILVDLARVTQREILAHHKMFRALITGQEAAAPIRQIPCLHLA